MILGINGIETDLVPSYQNQTQEDIESGRARINSADSIVSFDSGSGHSDDALLPEVRIKRSKSKVTNVIQSYGSGHSEIPGSSGITTSPRRTNRENLSLLRARHRSSSYEEIGEIADYENSFPGMYKDKESNFINLSQRVIIVQISKQANGNHAFSCKLVNISMNSTCLSIKTNVLLPSCNNLLSYSDNSCTL